MIQQFLSGYIPKRVESRDTDTCTPMFIAALFTIAKRWKPKMEVTQRSIDR